ncbi:MAG TPA: zinc ribbon domain-containing protein [Longimicrobiales bacterium]|jgi:putative FmdB family regulatory protein
MPTYEYQCKDCHTTFTRIERITEHGSVKPTCPNCKSENVEQLLAPVFAKTSKKS